MVKKIIAQTCEQTFLILLFLHHYAWDNPHPVLKQLSWTVAIQDYVKPREMLPNLTL